MAVPLTVNGIDIALALAKESWAVMVALPVFSALDWVELVKATVGAASSSVIVRTALAGVPRAAVVAVLRVILIVSSTSSVVSLVMAMVKVLLAESASAQLKVPEAVV